MRILMTFAAVLFSAAVFAQPALELTTILPSGSFATPVDIKAPKDGTYRLFVVEKRGTIRMVDLATETIAPGFFLNIQNKVVNSGERGFLGLAFHPDFATNGQFFINYSSNGSVPGASNGDNVISRITLASPDATTADPTTEEVLLILDQPYSNHNGGNLEFGPDGYLYIGTGDGGSGGDPDDYGQNPQSLLGKMLRIDVNTSSALLNYGIPPDNPFVNDAGTRDEIWAIGLRNPWRYSFDRETGDLWIGDVGQNAREEINFEAAGSTGGLNYGWDCREGLISFSNSSAACNSTTTYLDPVADFPHSGSASAFSITGGYVYRGGAWPDLQGTYICADYVTNIFFTIKADGTGGWDVMNDNSLGVDRITSFGESDLGELYFVESNGRLRQVGGGAPSATRSYFGEANFQVTVSPNPAQRQLRIDLGELSGDDTMKMRLVDVSGRTVLAQTWTLPAGPHARTIHLPELASGVYQLVMTNSSGGRVVPVVIQ